MNNYPSAHSIQALRRARRNLRLTIAESGITAGTLSMAIITPFFYSIGLSNTEISLTQILFTLVAIGLEIPTGYLADRLGRKWANIIGDFGHGLLFLVYARTSSFAGVVLCESLMGITIALSDGVDQSLIKHFSDQIAHFTGANSTHLLSIKTAKVELCKQVCNLILLSLGGPLGALDLRLAIALSSVNHFVGGIISFFVVDDSPKLQRSHRSACAGIFHIIRETLYNPALRLRIALYAVGREMTHAIIFIATPLLSKAGVPLQIISFAWAANALMSVIGAKLAQRFSHRLNEKAIFVIPLVLLSTSEIILGLHLSLVTVWLYLVTGLVQGWTASTLAPMVQKYTDPTKQTSVLSFAKVCSRCFYVVISFATGLAADISIEYGIIASSIIVILSGSAIIKKLSN